MLAETSRSSRAVKLTLHDHRLLLQRQNNKALLQAKSKFLLLHSPTHHVHSLAQILSSPEVRLPYKPWTKNVGLIWLFLATIL